MTRILNYLPVHALQLVMCCIVWMLSGCTSLLVSNTELKNPEETMESEIVTGVWIFEKDQIEVKLARVDDAELMPAPAKNATRFTINSSTDKLVKYKTEQFRVDENQIDTFQKTSLLERPPLAQTDKEYLRGDAILSSFRGSVEMHGGVPVEFTLQNTDIDGDTPYVYSRVSMQVIAREYTGETSLISTIECVSFPKFLCTKADAPQSAQF